MTTNIKKFLDKVADKAQTLVEDKEPKKVTESDDKEHEKGKEKEKEKEKHNLRTKDSHSTRSRRATKTPRKKESMATNSERRKRTATKKSITSVTRTEKTDKDCLSNDDLKSTNNKLTTDTKKTTVASVLIPPVDSTPSERCKIVMRRFATMCLAKGVEALLQEFNDLKVTCSTVDQLNHASFDKNPEKNRYKDIVCIEESRVKLVWPPDSTNDYIHANWIRDIPGSEKQFICTQGPTENTIEDFWRMVWQEKVAAILMLCCVIESGKKKCEQYWPAEQGQSMTVGSLTVTNGGVKAVGKVLQYTKLKITGPNNKTHTVNHVLWDNWPDKGVPLSSTGALRLIFRTQTLNPAIVHCSAGVGRTGTIVGLEICMRVLNGGNELSVYNVIKELRSRRFLACQTDLQYLYIHRSILAFITSKNILSGETVSNFVSDYENLVKSRQQNGGG